MVLKLLGTRSVTPSKFVSTSKQFQNKKNSVFNSINTCILTVVTKSTKSREMIRLAVMCHVWHIAANLGTISLMFLSFSYNTRKVKYLNFGISNWRHFCYCFCLFPKQNYGFVTKIKLIFDISLEMNAVMKYEDFSRTQDRSCSHRSHRCLWLRLERGVMYKLIKAVPCLRICDIILQHAERQFLPSDLVCCSICIYINNPKCEMFQHNNPKFSHLHIDQVNFASVIFQYFREIWHFMCGDYRLYRRLYR